jgi:hypothetical protein
MNRVRVHGLAQWVGMLAVVVSSVPPPPHTQASGVSTLVQNLPRYLARSRPTWPKDPLVEGGEGTVMGAPRPWAVSFKGPGIRSFESDSAFTSGDRSESCANWPYRHFFTDRDTITFTFARIPEGCSESPGMRFRDSTGAARRVDVTPLFNWNVDAIWLTPHCLVFAVTAEYESALPQFVRIACWELETGRWFTSPTRGYLMHRPGFDLPALLPDWYSARAYETGGAVVLRGKKRALALWPERRAWSLVDAVTGRPTSDRARSTSRRIVTSPERRIGPRLKNEIRSVFAKVHDKVNREIVDFNIIDLIQEPCASGQRQYAVTARAVGRDRASGGPKMDWTRELFGVCIIDSSLTHVTKSFAPFPTYRWADTTVYFDLDAPDDSIVVWEEGTTYSDVGGRFAYPCPQ